MNDITINTQSSIKIEDNGKVIYFDPFQIEEETHDADIVFITHDHYDHFSKEDYEKVSNENTIFVLPKSIHEGFDGFAILLNPNDKTKIMDYIVEAYPAYNRFKPFHPKSKKYLGYKVYLSNYSIYVCGDTDFIPELKNMACNILFVPIGGKFTMDYKEAAKLTNTIEPKIVIPIHYGSIVGSEEDFDKFSKLIKNEIKVIKKL